MGPIGEVKRWTLYRDFLFANNGSALSNSDRVKVSEIARFSKEHPSLWVAIDSSMETPRNQALSDRRNSALRSALINAGVPPANIQIGAYGDERVMRAGRTAVLVNSAK